MTTTKPLKKTKASPVADLECADLACADLAGADLAGANLRSANLRSANLTSADLARADLECANLTGADLTGANLRSANLTGADLRSAYLTRIRDDIWQVLDAAAAEVPALLAAVVGGRIDGSTYSGSCACLVGTIAAARGCGYQDLGFAADQSRPAEQWFVALAPGDTPDRSQVAAVTAVWIEEWQAAQSSTTGASS